ncbi:MAG: DUF11 domain-containing protein [Thermoflexales bacterium]|nr:DUF11 domain-containing protein [Thermoflexales bacterium]
MSRRNSHHRLWPPLLLALLGLFGLCLVLSPRASARPALQEEVTLSLSKTESADPVPAGHTLVYTLTYGNPTTETVTGVVLTDTLDLSVVYQAAVPEPTLVMPNALYWEIGALSGETGGQIVLTVTVSAALPDGAVITNTATIAGDGAPPQTVYVTTTVAAPDLQMTKGDAPDPAVAGAPLTYTLRYTNAGSAPATGVVVTDLLDSRVLYAGASPPPDGGAPTTPYWNVDGLLPSASGQILVFVTVTSGLGDGTVLTNVAHIGRDGAAPLAVTETTAVLAHGNPVSLSLAPPTAAISAGASIAYALTAHDLYGNSWDVTGLGNYSVDPAAGGIWAANRYTACVAGTWTVTATYGALAATATLTVTPGAPSTLTVAPKSATVTAGQVQTYTAASADLCANLIGDVTSSTVFTISSGAGGAWDGNRYTAEKDGAWTVTATWGTLHDTAVLTVTNVPPTARAGGPYTAAEGSSVLFDGRASSDPGNDIALYEWDFFYTGVFQQRATGVTVTYAYTDNGLYTAALRVWDDNGEFGLDTAPVTVTNAAPTVDAGPDRQVNEGTSVQFTGAFTDPGSGDTHAILWTFGDGGSFSGALTPTHVYSEPGAFLVTLVVTDDDGGAGSDSLTVTVLNLPPTASAGGPYSGNEGATIPITGTGSDPGGGVLAYAWDLNGDGVYTDATTATTSYSWGEPGVYTVSLRVADSGGLTATTSATVTVLNLPPTASAGGPYSGNEGATIPITGTGSDPGGGVLAYAWDLNGDGVYTDATTATTSYSWGEPGVYTVSLRVTDSGGLTATASATVTVYNLPPTASAGGPYTGTAGVPVTLVGSGSDPGGGPLTYTWDLNFDGQYGDAVGAAVQYTWTVAAVYTVALRVEDAQHAAATSTARVTIQPAALHHIIVSPDTATIQAGQSQTYTTAAYDTYGNWRGDVTNQTTFSILQSGHGGYWVDNVYVSRNPGTWTVVGTHSGISDTAVLTVLAPILNLVKADLTDPVDAGAYLTYTLAYSNTGNQTATESVVTDTLDGNVIYSGATPAPSGFVSGNPYWTLGSLAPNTPGQITLRVQVRTPLTNGTVLTNVAVIGCAQTAPVTAVQTTTVRSAPILLLTKADGPDPVEAGAQLAYTLTYQNTGNEVARGVVVTDVLDIRALFVSSSPPAQGSGQTRYWTLGDLAPGAPGTIRITATVQSPLPNGTVLTNTAWLDSDQTSPVIAVQTTTVSSRPVLTMTKSDAPDPVVAGEILYYTIVITNSGNENATGVVVTETYDANVSYVYANPPPQSGSGNRRWTFGSLPVGSPQTIEVVVRVASPLPAGTVLTNRVALDTDQTVPFTVTETTQVLSEPSLKVVQVDDPDPVPAGGELVYSIACQNTGTAPATGVRITDTYDSRVTFLSANPSPTQGNNVWVVGTLNPGGVYNLVVRVRVHSPLPDGTMLANMVTVSSNESPPANFITTTQVAAAPAVTFTVADGPDPVPAGGTLTYTLRYTNTGNADATGVVVTATLDPRVTFTDATPPPTGGSGTTPAWNVGAIPGEGGVGRIDLRVRVTSPLTNGTVLPFQARLTYAEGAPLTATAQTVVTSAPVLTLSKSDGVTVVYAGDQLTYTLIVTNSGNEDAAGIVVTDTLPNHAAYLGCELAERCQRVGESVVFQIPFLPAPGVFQGRVGVQVDHPLAAGADRVVNRARMTAPSLAAPVEVEDVDLIGTRPDLRLAVAHKPSLFSPGKVMTFTVAYSNTGAMHAEGVVITAVIPAATVYAGGGWQFAGGQTYTYPVGTLPAGNAGPTVTLVISHVWQAGVGAEQFSIPFTIGNPHGDAQPADNSHTVLIGVPDLVITDFQVEPTALKPNELVTFTIGIWNRGTGMAWNPDNNGGFWVDVFTDPVPSYPCESYGFAYAGVSALAPGGRYTVTLVYNGFTAQEIQGIREFYARVDNHRQYPYGLVPESDEMNNVAGPLTLRPYVVYLPLVCRGR